MISYAGYDLTDVTGDVDARLAEKISHAWTAHAAAAWFPEPPAVWPGPNELGVLYWPAWGASRHARGFFLVDSKTLDIIRPLCYQSTGLTPRDLLINDGVSSVSIPLYMLPPLPLEEVDRREVPGVSSLWLLPLVDIRYFWKSRPIAISDFYEGNTTWAQLYAAAASDLGATITVDDVASEYGYPPDFFASFEGAAAELLDIVASSCGHRLCFLTDGSVRSRSATGSMTAHAANLLLADRLAGGHLRVGDVPDNDDGPANYPDAVEVSYPRGGGPRHAETVYLNTLGLSADLGPTADRATADEPTVHRVESSAVAGPHEPADNADELLSLAQRIATDFYRHLSGRAEARYAGVVAWDMDGLTGWVEYGHRLGMLSTRVRRPQPEAPPCGACGVRLAHRSSEYGWGWATGVGVTTFVPGTQLVFQGGGLALEDDTPVLAEDDSFLTTQGGTGVVFDAGSSLVIREGTEVTVESVLVITSRGITGEDDVPLLFEDGTLFTEITYPGIDFAEGSTLTVRENATFTNDGTTIHNPSRTTTTADLDNFDPGNSTFLEIVPSGGGALNLTGIVPKTVDGASASQLLVITHGGSDPLTTLTLTDDDGSSTATNRFAMPGDSSLTLGPGDAATLWYDTTGQRWRPVSGTALPARPYAPTLSGSSNDYPIPANAVSLTPTLSAASTLTGLARLPTGVPFLIVNPTANADDLTLSHLSGLSLAADRFDFTGAADVVLAPGETLWVVNNGSKIVDAGASLSHSTGGTQAAVLVTSAVSQSNVAQINLTGLSGYKILKIVGTGFQTKAVVADPLYLRTSTDGGSTYDSGGSDYQTSLGAAAQLTIQSCQPDSSANTVLSFEVTLYAPDDAAGYKYFQWNSVVWDGLTLNQNNSYGARLSGGDIDAIRLLGSTANINGSVYVWGWK